MGKYRGLRIPQTRWVFLRHLRRQNSRALSELNSNSKQNHSLTPVKLNNCIFIKRDKEFFFWNVTMYIKLAEIQIPPVNRVTVFTTQLQHVTMGNVHL